MNDAPPRRIISPTGIGAFVAASFLLLLDLFLMLYIPVESCMATKSGTRRGRFVEQFLCSPTLLDDGFPGIVRFATLWGPLAILIAYWVHARRRRGSS